MRKITFIILYISALCCNAQNLSLRNYGIEDGISQSFIYSLNQDDKGYLWIGTGEGLVKFDGHNFQTITSGDSLSEDFVATSYKDNNGKIWYGHQNGGITCFDNGTFKKINVSKIPANIITSIKEHQGTIWYSTQSNGLVKIDSKDKLTNYSTAFRDKLVFDFQFTNEGNLLVATDLGLLLYEMVDGFPRFSKNISEIPEGQINKIIKYTDSNEYWICTNDFGLIKLTIDYRKKDYISTKSIGDTYGINMASVLSIFFDSNENLWIATDGNGVYKAAKTKSGYSEFVNIIGLNKELEISGVIYEDRENNIWIGTSGNSLATIKDNKFEIYPVIDTLVNESVSTILVNDSLRIFGLKGVLIKENFVTNKRTSYTNLEGLPNDLITCSFIDRDQNYWIGTENNGIYVKYKNSNIFEEINYSGDNLANSVNAITGEKQFIWFATKFGLYRYNKITKDYFIYTTETELHHNNISHLYKEPNTPNLWVATLSNYLIRIKGTKIDSYEIKNSTQVLNITSLTSDDKGLIWLSTYGNGVYMFNKKNFTPFKNNNELLSQYCYSLIYKENSIWIGHRSGASKINLENSSVKIYQKDEGFYGDCNYNAIATNSSGNIWIGTTKGVCKYIPEKDKPNSIAPKTDFVSTIIFNNNTETINRDSKISLKNGVYKLKFNFIGLSFKESEKLTYSYKLEGHDLEWTEGDLNNFVSYNRVEPGTYKFKVKSCNSDGYCDENIASIDIFIDKPYWRKWWFILIVSTVLIYSIYLLIKFREKRQRNLQKYLETKLNERTREVVEKKNELETVHQDITDSINYAKRIQKAIMPLKRELNKHLPESFIFFRPRDIVSGDFYWFKRISEERIVIACADATGHGVPGAFMSMIGSTILEDASKRKSVDSPQDMMYTLEEEIVNMLSNEDGDEITRDGMDISICEINLKTQQVKVCSAMRPVFLISNGELIDVKSSRNPIGGGYSNKKQFEIETYQLKKGDMIYMFTDGYPDQFGGPKGKKYKTSRLKEVFDFMKDKKGKEQLNIISNNFDKWTENHDQIDDVLVMGIRL